MKIILTGDRPTGKLHIGHYVGSLKKRIELQNSDYDKFFVMIADTQALTDNFGTPKKVRDSIVEVMLDYLSVGLDPKKIIFFIQSEIKALPELTIYYMNLVTIPRLLRNPTVKSEIKLRGFDGDKGIPVGFANYPISQAADITAFKATLVPVGEDQLPMVEQTREIVHSFNRLYKDVLSIPKPIIPDNDVCLRLPGIDGNAKMGKSLGNCIYLSDDSQTVLKKVKSMYTDPKHIKITDPGNIDGNIVFTYLDAFCKDEHFKKYLSEYNNLQELKEHYQTGGLGDMKIKMFLYNILEELLTPIRNRRKYYEKRIPEVINILKEGSILANQYAEKTLLEVKEAMGMNYFDEKFKNEQIIKYKN
mgnify:FL=1